MRATHTVCLLLLALVHCAALVKPLAGTALAADSQTNFLVIIADDLGYSDLGCYGGEIATPNLDALAAGGLRFTQFYNTARCWPTRAALVTGYYPQQVRRDNMPGVSPKDFGGGGQRPAWARTVAEYLKPLGYRTYHSGKWHIDGNPTEHGFDVSDQISRGAGFFEAAKLRKQEAEQVKATGAKPFYLTTGTAEHAISCLREHAERHADKPFFHYLAFHAPHFPLHALPEDIARYRDRYLSGWDQLRLQRHARQKEMGLSTAELSALEPTIGPPYDFPDQLAQLGPGEINRPLPWQELNETQQQFQAHKMAIHAAMVDRMDREIGRVLDQIRAMGVWDDTLVCFVSDNGASAEIMVRGDGHDPAAEPGSADTYLCLGPGFSSAANTPFRRHKTWVSEGGIATPFIVHWPNGIAARNELRQTMAHVIDIAPTVIELAQATATAAIPEFPELADAPPQPGRSLSRVFQSDGAPVHEELWFYHEGSRALRQGDWKLVYVVDDKEFPWGSSEIANAKDVPEVPWSLYDLATDRAEQHDLAQMYPGRVRDMAARWNELREQFIEDARR